MPLKVIREIATALEYMQSFSYAHRDLKAHNVLISKKHGAPWASAIAKVCDFGSAKTCIFDDGTNKHT